MAPVSDQSGSARGLVSPEQVARVQAALAVRGLDSWLLFEFRGQNWISASLLAVEHTTRRAWALFPRDAHADLPVAGTRRQILTSALVSFQGVTSRQIELF